MERLTVELDDDLLQRSSARAADAGLSMSSYVASLLERDVSQLTADSDRERLEHVEALERVFSMPKLNISKNGHMPSAAERNTRR